MNTTNDNQLMLSRKGRRELKRQINLLEHDRNKILQALHETDKTLSREDRLDRAEKIINLKMLESELLEKKQQLSHSGLLPSKRSSLRVILGSVVDLIDKHGKLFRYRLVDSIEANPSDGRISTKSPLGKNLLGKTLQDIVENKNGNDFNRFILVRIF